MRNCLINLLHLTRRFMPTDPNTADCVIVPKTNCMCLPIYIILYYMAALSHYNNIDSRSPKAADNEIAPRHHRPLDYFSFICVISQRSPRSFVGCQSRDPSAPLLTLHLLPNLNLRSAHPPISTRQQVTPLASLM